MYMTCDTQKLINAFYITRCVQKKSRRAVVADRIYIGSKEIIK